MKRTQRIVCTTLLIGAIYKLGDIKVENVVDDRIMRKLDESGFMTAPTPPRA